MSDLYLMYLRKSRADRDFIDEDVMKTLNRHKERLDTFCKDQCIAISQVFYEIVSADSIAARPEMLKLLQLVETGIYKGVVVIDMDRLCRGDSIDQGIVMNTFKYSGTNIITPYKSYDFTNEFDEEYAEYGLMMGRSEYRKIKRRLWNGRLDSVREGKYVGGNPPYGYKTYKLAKQKGYSLETIPEQANIIKIIFQMYVNGILEDGIKRDVGASVIAKKLNEMGYVNQFGQPWSHYHITKMLQDETYTGKIVYMRRRERKEVRNGSLVKIEENNSPDKIVVDGLHEAIISEELFRQAQDKRLRKQVPHLRIAATLQNPLCGLVQCGLCGKNLNLRSIDTTSRRALFCPNVNCECVGSYIDLVEERLIKAIGQWTTDYHIQNATIETDDSLLQTSLTNSINSIDKELDSVNKQLANIYDFLEKGIYSVEVFQERSAALNENISALIERRDTTTKKLDKVSKYRLAKKELLPKVQTVIEKYFSLHTASERNLMLKEVIDKIVYTKTDKGRGHADSFKIEVFPKIPKL